jgi:hypothetical protein
MQFRIFCLPASFYCVLSVTFFRLMQLKSNLNAQQKPIIWVSSMLKDAKTEIYKIISLLIVVYGCKT